MRSRIDIVFLSLVSLAIASPIELAAQCSAVPTNQVLVPSIATYSLYGWRVALHGDHLLVAESHASTGTIQLHGRVNVYRRQGEQWVMIQAITPSPLVQGVQFGKDLAVQDGVAVIGQLGSVSVYQFNGASWVFDQKLSVPGSNMGQWVDFDGTTIAAANPSFPWRVHVYESVADNWVQIQQIDLPPEIVGQSGAREIAIDGDDLFVRGTTPAGAPVGTGLVVHYHRDFAESFELGGVITPPIPHSGFASGIDFDGQRLVIGSQQESSVLISAGRAYVYEQGAMGWELVQELFPSDAVPGLLFGIHVAVSGDRIVVGGSCNTSLSPPISGRAYLYEKVGTEWRESRLGTQPLADVAAYGHSVAIDGRRVAVTSPFEQEYGRVHTFDLAPTFLRGDCNRDGEVDIADGVRLVQYLFLGGVAPECSEGCDTNDDSLLDLADALAVFAYSLGIGPSPPTPAAPFPDIGSDSDDDPWDCFFECD